MMRKDTPAPVPYSTVSGSDRCSEAGIGAPGRSYTVTETPWKIHSSRTSSLNDRPSTSGLTRPYPGHVHCRVGVEGHLGHGGKSPSERGISYPGVLGWPVAALGDHAGHVYISLCGCQVDVTERQTTAGPLAKVVVNRGPPSPDGDREPLPTPSAGLVTNDLGNDGGQRARPSRVPLTNSSIEGMPAAALSRRTPATRG